MTHNNRLPEGLTMSASLKTRSESRYRPSSPEKRTKQRPIDVRLPVTAEHKDRQPAASLTTAKPVRVVWTIKTALHGSVFPVDGVARGDGWFTPNSASAALRIGKDCFLSRDEAHDVATLKRQNEITKLEKQIRRLKELIGTTD